MRTILRVGIYTCISVLALTNDPCVAQDIVLGGEEGDSSLWFFDGGTHNGQRLFWDDSSGRFVLSEGLDLSGHELILGDSESLFDGGSDVLSTASSLSVGGTLDVAGAIESSSLLSAPEVHSAGDVLLNADGSGSASSWLYFFEDGSPEGEFFGWEDSKDQFLLSDDLEVPATILTDELRSRGNLFVNYAGPDGDSFIFFRDSANPQNEFLKWEDSKDQFRFSNSVYLFGELRNAEIADEDTIFNIIDSDNNEGISKWRLYRHSIDSGDRLAEIDQVGTLTLRGDVVTNGFDLAEVFLAKERVEVGQVVSVLPGSPESVVPAKRGLRQAVVGVVSGNPSIILGGAALSPGDLDRWGSGLRESFDRELSILSQETIDRHGEELKAQFELSDKELQELARSPMVSKADSARLARARNELVSLALDRFTRERFVPVALAGRVLVNVDASNQPIEVGDELTVGSTPGVAVSAVDDGPTVGIALEPHSSGYGQILAWVHRGYTRKGSTGLSSEMGDEGSVASGGSLIRLDERRIEKMVEQEVQDQLAPILGVQSSDLYSQDDMKGRFGASHDEYTAQLLRVQGGEIAQYRRSREATQVGEVVVADREHAGVVTPCVREEDPAVVGVVAGRVGLAAGASLKLVEDAQLLVEHEQTQEGETPSLDLKVGQELVRLFEEYHVPITAAGFARVRVDASYGPVAVGDLLTTSPTKGHAMRANDPEIGTIVGKALEDIDGGQALIEVLVMIR